MTPQLTRRLTIGTAAAVAGIVVAVLGWLSLRTTGPGNGFVNGNGRLEATEIDIATKLPGRVHDILVDEGDFVKRGQVLVLMEVEVLGAQRDEARAQSRQAAAAVASADAQVTARESDTVAAQAMVALRESDLDAAQRRLARTTPLSRQGVVPLQEFDDDGAHMRGAVAALAASKAQVAATQAAIKAAQAQVVGAASGVTAAEATIARIEADISDSQLTAPRDGRIQYRVAQPGEVLAGGGKVLNLIDLGDVYLTFFLPETAVGRVALGSEVRIVLDAAPLYVIPATVSFIASSAQFTPKTVETASERQKLMFRVKAQIGRELLEKHRQQVKAGLPGVAWLKLDQTAQWPAALEIRASE